MIHSFEESSKFGKEFVDSGVKSFASLSRGAQAIAIEASDFSKKTFEAGSAAMESLASAKSVEKAIEIQTEFARKAYESFIAEATKMAELYADMAKEAYKPFEAIVARAR